MKILLNNKRSRLSTNKDTFLSVGLENQMKKVSNKNDEHLVDVYQVYLDEKDASDKYRLIFTINPVCTNALFNAITEIVYKEGSPDCERLLSFTGGTAPDKVKYPNIISEERINRLQAIRDTEYSNEKIYGLTYLPGIDLFNNHLMRQNGFNCIMKRTDDTCKKDGVAYDLSGSTFSTATTLIDVFNTIRDYQRTQDGKKIIKKFPGVDSTYLSPITGQTHVYQESEILDFDTTIKTRLKEKDGWFGFYNPSTLNIPIAKDKNDSTEDIYINKLLNNRNACDFIDMFPDRTRYSFVPHKNKYRDNRLEKNWDYCLTYPYSSTEYLTNENGEPLLDENGNAIPNPIVAGVDSNGQVRNGLMFSVVEQYVTDGDKRRVLLQSPNSIHNLHPNDKINIYYCSGEGGLYDSGGTFDHVSNVSVKGVGNKNGELQQYYFSIDADDVPNWFDDEGKLIESGKRLDIYGNLVGGIQGRFCKTVFGVECMYYFRIFRRLPNFSEVSKEEGRSYYISEYNKESHDFNSEINKLAFANNIYGDSLAQIVYLDDIDVNGLTDNLERPLSDIYLTIVKANRGHEEWYPETGRSDCKSEKVEISRAFGKVTSGIDLPPEDGFMCDYNVHRIHNIDFKKICSGIYSGYRAYVNLGNLHKNYKVINDGAELTCRWEVESLKTLEDDIKIGQEFFIGDLVEFCIPRYEETIIEPVYHRFNTAQREYANNQYRDIIVDEIYMDDYEGSETAVTKNATTSIDGNFKCVQEIYNQGYEKVESENKKKLIKYPGNLFPEGYYYQPHYRIHLKDVSEKISQSSDTQVLLADGGDVVTGDTDSQVTFITANDYDIIAKDEIVIQDSLNNIFYDAIVTSVTGITGETIVEASLENGMRLDYSEMTAPSHFLVFKKTLGIPKYAVHYPDTGGKYIWRSLVSPSKVSTESELYDKPFSNGAHYRHVGINFFLKRQDPFGYYELNTKNEYEIGETNKLTNFIPYGSYNESIYYNDAIDFGIIDIC